MLYQLSYLGPMANQPPAVRRRCAGYHEGFDPGDGMSVVPVPYSSPGDGMPVVPVPYSSPCAA